MTHDIEVAVVDPMPLAVVRRQLGAAQVAAAWRPALDRVWAFVRGQEGLWAGGHNVFVYHEPAGPGERMMVEFGVQVTRRIDGDGEVEASQTPAGRVASTVHVGRIDGLGAAYAALDTWLAEHGEVAAGVTWETYGDWAEDPAENETRVTCLLR